MVVIKMDKTGDGMTLCSQCKVADTSACARWPEAHRPSGRWRKPHSLEGARCVHCRPPRRQDLPALRELRLCSRGALSKSGAGLNGSPGPSGSHALILWSAGPVFQNIPKRRNWRPVRRGEHLAREEGVGTDCGPYPLAPSVMCNPLCSGAGSPAASRQQTTAHVMDVLSRHVLLCKTPS